MYIQCFEQWRPVPNFPKYYVSNYGNIKRNVCGLPEFFPKPRTDRAGYKTVRLKRNRRHYTNFVHRLVAASFLPNHGNLPQVNHVNGDKQLNTVQNLEWVTHADNVRHANQIGLVSHDLKMRRVRDVATGQLYKSVKEAAKAIKIPYSTCKNYLNGTRPNLTNLQYE